MASSFVMSRENMRMCLQYVAVDGEMINWWSEKTQERTVDTILSGLYVLGNVQVCCQVDRQCKRIDRGVGLTIEKWPCSKGNLETAWWWHPSWLSDVLINKPPNGNKNQRLIRVCDLNLMHDWWKICVWFVFTCKWKMTNFLPLISLIATVAWCP